MVNFANLNATSEQEGNPGGVRTLLVCEKQFIDGVWPKKADTTTGEITTLPTMKATAKFAAYECPDGTVEVSSEKQGDPGFQSFKHNVEFMLAGFSKTIQADATVIHSDAGGAFGRNVLDALRSDLCAIDL